MSAYATTLGIFGMKTPDLHTAHPAMAYKLILTCLIEGWNKHFKVVIRNPNVMDVDALREHIFEKKCKAWSEFADTLSLS